MTTAKVQTAVESDTPLTEKARDALHHSVDAMAEHAAKAEGAVRDTAGKSAESLNATQEKYVSQWNASQVKKFASENPIATAGIAFAAGMLLTTLLRGRK